jgi:hypothetical protein
MKQTLAIILFILTVALHSTAQTDSAKFYKEAFAEQLQMLKGQKPISFKRAVFLTENAFYKGQLNYQTFCNSISSTGQQLKTLIKQRGLDKFKTASNWAVFTYMTDSLPVNNYKPCTYDFDDFMGDKDFTKMFVTKLMKAKSGNCHSMPTYYKILCEEIGGTASLALAPNHLYIKHIDERGQWTNLELTNGGFPRDQWIIKEMAISVEAIKSGAYMSPLTAKQSIALTMFDLTSAYKFQHGYDSFVLKVTNTALTYFPKCIPLLMTKANYYKTVGEAEKKKKNPNVQFLKDNYALYKQTLAKIDKLGYKEMPTELYEQWVKSVEKEKTKRGLTKNK